MQAMEERALFLLLLLQPAAAPHGLRDLVAGAGGGVEYYLGLLPNVILATRAPGSPWSRWVTRRPRRSAASCSRGLDCLRHIRALSPTRPDPT